MLERWPDDVNDRSYLIEVAPERAGGRHSDALRFTQVSRRTQAHTLEGLARNQGHSLLRVSRAIRRNQAQSGAIRRNQ